MPLDEIHRDIRTYNCTCCLPYNTNCVCHIDRKLKLQNKTRVLVSYQCEAIDVHRIPFDIHIHCNRNVSIKPIVLIPIETIVISIATTIEHELLTFADFRIEIPPSYTGTIIATISSITIQ